MTIATLSELNETARREIRAEMARQGLSQAELAARLGRSAMFLSHRLKGSVSLSLADIDAIARMLHVPVDQLIMARTAGKEAGR